MKKYLLTFEFRYTAKSEYEDFENYITKTITVGIYEDIEKAIEAGDEALGKISGLLDVRDRFTANFIFGSPRDLVTNTCTRDKVHFFAKITTLNFRDLNETVAEALRAVGETQKT